MPFARIAITLPADVLASLDRRARQLDRSRSRVIVDAIRALLAAPAAVREPAAPAYGPDAIGSARHAQLEQSLARSPAERLRLAEEAAGTARAGQTRAGRRHQIIGFDSYDDFYEWKKNQRA